jgi:hypothetical protein
LAIAVCHVFAVVGTAALLLLVRDHGYQWATDLARQVDAGPSAGFLGAAAVASATLRPPWRGRVRVALGAYVFLSAIHLGALADVEHALAVVGGLLLGPVLQGRRPRLSLRALTRRDYRLLACGFFVLAAVQGLFQPFSPVTGPLTSTLSESARSDALQNGDDLIAASIQAVVWLVRPESLQGPPPRLPQPLTAPRSSYDGDTGGHRGRGPARFRDRTAAGGGHGQQPGLVDHLAGEPLVHHAALLRLRRLPGPCRGRPRTVRPSGRAARGPQNAGATCVDLYAPYKGDGSRNPTALLAGDGDHPNAAGNQLISSALMAATSLP